MAETALMRDPIYHQLNDRLRGMISGGRFGAGDKFLTEREVSERFGVSRVTANKALSQLVMAGVLEFRKGVGTFVRGDALQNDLRSLVSFTRKAAVSGKTLSTQVLAFTKLKAADAGDSVAHDLQVSPAESLLYLERLRIADGDPVILERRFLVARLCPGLTKDRVKGSLYDLLESDLGLKLTGAEQTIRAINLTATDAKQLKARPNAAALWVHAVGFVDAGPLWVEDTLYRSDRYEFANVLGSRQAPRPATPSLSAQHQRPSFRG